MLSGSLLLCKTQLTAALCHYSYTHASLPFIQLCICPTAMHNSSAQGTKHAFWLTAALQKLADSSLVPLRLHSCRFALHTGLQLPNSDAQQLCPGQEHAFWLIAALQKPTDSSLLPLQLHPCKFVLHTALHLPNSETHQLCPGH